MKPPRLLSLDELVAAKDGDGEQEPRGNQIPDPAPGPEERVVEAINHADFLKFLRQVLTHNEFFVFIRHAGLDCESQAYKAIGQEVGKSQSWAHALGQSALKKLRSSKVAYKVREYLK